MCRLISIGLVLLMLRLRATLGMSISILAAWAGPLRAVATECGLCVAAVNRLFGHLIIFLFMFLAERNQKIKYFRHKSVVNFHV
jgi:hypothetical protein